MEKPSMMRWKLALVAVLALPLAASADGLLRNGGCATGNCGHGFGHGGYGFGHGGFGSGGNGSGYGGYGHGGKGGWGNGPCAHAGDGRHGFGLFQAPFQAAPWYLYWPYDQHFQLPAPIN